MNSEDNMSDIQKLLKEAFLETLETVNESDDHTVLEKEPHRVGWREFDGKDRRMWQMRHTNRGALSKLKKGMTDHEKKHMKGAYIDDSDVVHRKTGRTMSNLLDHKNDKAKTYGEVRKEIQAHIAKHHPEK